MIVEELTQLVQPMEEFKSNPAEVSMINTCDPEEDSDSFVLIQNDPEVTEDLNTGERRGIELELLSNIDPDDEFLRQSESSYSLIEKMSVDSSSYSLLEAESSAGYSIIHNSELHDIIKSFSIASQIGD